MKINLLICNDSDEALVNETFDDFDDAITRLVGVEYEYDAIIGNLTGGDNE